MNCKICKHDTTEVFVASVLGKYNVKYYQCNSCKFIQTEKVYWLEEAYKNAINDSDTGIIVRNERFRKIVSVLLLFVFNKKEKFLDYAGGYGIFTRMMRDVGFDYYWLDEFARNYLAIGFDHQKHVKYNAITAFEVFEHLDDPLGKLENMLSFSDAIIFSTELVPNNVPSKEWWYFAFSHGQHIAFYHKKTLEFIAAKYDLHLVSNGSNFHMLSKRKVSSILFSILYKGSKYGLFSLCKLVVKSRTFSDHKSLSRA